MPIGARCVHLSLTGSLRGVSETLAGSILSLPNLRELDLSMCGCVSFEDLHAKCETPAPALEILDLSLNADLFFGGAGPCGAFLGSLRSLKEVNLRGTFAGVYDLVDVPNKDTVLFHLSKPTMERFPRDSAFARERRMLVEWHPC